MFRWLPRFFLERFVGTQMTKSSLVVRSFNEHQIQFQSDGWFNATEAAAKFGKTPVIYCVIFSHGLSKVGKTTNIKQRLDSLACHGLLIPLFSHAVIQPCRDGALNSAEKIALDLFRAECIATADEVFKFSDVDRAKAILLDASCKAVSNTERKPKSESCFRLIAEQTGLDDALLAIAIEDRKDQSTDEAINFALTSHEKSESDFHSAYECLHPFAADLAGHLCIRNALLIGRGVAYDARKPMLQQYALDWRLGCSLKIEE